MNNMKKWLIRFKKEKFKGKIEMIGPIFALLLAVGATFYLSFQYFFLADFPIGHDVIYHIYRAQQIEQNGLIFAFKTSLYPLSYLVFILWHKVLSLFHLDWPQIFIFFECANLFSVSLLTGLLSYKIFKDWKVAVIAMILVASSRWLNDSLRIGLMGESFGWIFFMVGLIALFEKKWLWFLLGAIILFFSHPLPFGVLLIVLFFFSFYWFFRLEKRDKINLLLTIGIILLVFLIFYFVLPNIGPKIFDILKIDFSIEGERTIFHYMIDYDKKRLLLYGFAFWGLVFLILNIFRKKIIETKKEKIILLLIFAILSFWICFKHYLGIHYLGYRFYTYFEIIVSVLAAFSLVKVSQMLVKNFSFLLCLLFLPFIIYPNYYAIKEITQWQLSVTNSYDVTPEVDQKAILNLVKILEPNTKIYSNSWWANWFKIYGFWVVNDWGTYSVKIHQVEDFDSFRQFLQKRNYHYIYFSSTDKKAIVEKAWFLYKIYDQGGVRVYEIK